MNLKDSFSTQIAKKILGNKDQATSFLLTLQAKKMFTLPFKTISRGVNKGKKRLDLSTNELWEKIVTNWDYDLGKDIIRNIFKSTKKYKSGKNSHQTMQILLTEWQERKLGTIAWPFSQGNFDGFVQRVNSESITGGEKDDKVKKAAVQYRRIKEINTVRNDFIETLIFEKNLNILPTLNHRRAVDFFIDGVPFDQKVAKSPTNEFKRDFGDAWKQHAIESPATVAEYLYKYQDEGRFGADSRLLVVYLDEDVPIDTIEETIQKTDLENPLEITFEYDHKTQGKQNYKVKCFVILLHN